MRKLRKLSIIILAIAGILSAVTGVSSIINRTGFLDTIRIALDSFIDTENLFNDRSMVAAEDPAMPQEPVPDISELPDVVPAGFDYASVPEWKTTTPSVPVNGNVPFFTEQEKDQYMAFVSYSNLDLLGRCGPAFSCIGRESMPDEERNDEEERTSVTPTGWKQNRYPPTLVDQEFVYNRCHLIGWQLGGEANSLNLVTGTRYMNVSGMLPYENDVAQYLYDHPGSHVLYRVTPVFEGLELTCRGVLMEAYSLGIDIGNGRFEDDGSFQFCVFCYNEQPSVTINHLDGSNALNVY